MKDITIKYKINNIIISIYNNRIILSFLISILSFSMIILQIFHVNISSIIYNFYALFTLLFIPSYPVFFLILKRWKINILEKFTLTIISNISFYILIGYFISYTGLAITSFYYITITILSFLIIFLYSIAKLEKSNYQGFLFIEKKSKEYTDFCNTFSLLNYIKTKISLNFFLLLVFLMLICFFNLFSSSIFLGTDSWLHVSIIRFITEKNMIPHNEYFGAMGLHIYSAVFHFFSGIDILLIPKFYVFYTFPISAMILYIILKRIFNNQNLAIFGVFILEFSSLGFGNIMHLFWPESLAVLQLLTIFFILYLRIKEFTELKTIKKENIFKNLVISYTLITILFLSAFIIHSLVSLILLVSYLWIYLIFFLKDYRRGFDFIILCFLVGIIFIFYYLKIGVGHLFVFSYFLTLPVFYYFLLLLALIVVLFPIIRAFHNTIKFGQVEFFELDSRDFKKYLDFENKIIIPLSVIIVSFLSVLFMLGNIFSLNLDIVSAITSIEMFIFAFFAIWGIIIFQKISKGKILMIWMVGLGLLIFAALVYDMLFIVKGFWLRIIHLSSPSIIIGFISYIYKLVKIKAFEYKKFSIIVSIIIFFSLISAFSYDNTVFRHFSLERRELNTVYWYSEYTSNKGLVAIEFGWHYGIMYYDYPYDQNNESLGLDSVAYIKYVNSSILKPEEHISNNVNILQQLKNRYSTDFYIFLTDYYLVYGGWTFYDSLNQTQIQQYYNLPYLNRICSSKSIDGLIEPIYWVI
ncbi:MAG: hypothetical protein JXA99_17395 [Candidatus Lokiarchaeota archaeon]|nr:hypothetical protein [Candidatus Lokiarchaeota archaeon]